jgi:ribosomal protein L37AE/L43A
MESKYRFVTNRVVKNSKDEEKGKMRVMVPKGTDTAHVDYVCPECGFSKHDEVPWARPFAVKCSKCGFMLKLPKLKDEIKKDKKKAKAELEAKAQAGTQ